MAKDIQKQLEELTATVAVLANVVGNLMTVTPELTAPVATPKGGRKAAPKGKGRKATAPSVRIARSKNLVAFGEAAGYDLEGWTLQDLLDAIRDGGVEDFEVPEGWAFGPASETYLATGEWS